MAKKKRRQQRQQHPKRPARRNRRRDLILVLIGFWIFALVNHALPTLVYAFLVHF